MNSLVAQFDQIVEFAAVDRVPLTKKRGIIREFLHSKLLTLLYAHPDASKLSFVGGTALRLLHGLDRFSEDLDFDNRGLARDAVHELIARTVAAMRRENIQIELIARLKQTSSYHELRFPKLLFDLKLTTNPREKLMIKIDESSQWTGQKPEVLLFTKYGMIERIVTNRLEEIMVQKLAAYVDRKQTQPRDIYDLVWLFAQGARPDRAFMIVNHHEGLVEQARKKFDREGVSAGMTRRLQPFLFDETEVRKLSLFGNVLKQLEFA